MAKTLKTSGDYTVQAGAGYDSGLGLNTIKLDARFVRIPGDLTIDGTQTVVNSQTLTVEDQFIETNRNNSTAGTEDSGIFFNQGSNNHALFYYDAGNGEFQLGTTTQDATANTITDITLGQLKVATTPTDSNHAASKSYVDSTMSGGSFAIGFRGDDSAVVDVTTGNSVLIAGGSNISTAATESDTVTVALNQNLNDINSVSTGSSNGDLILQANGTGSIVVDNILTFNSAASTPTANTITKLYNKTAAGGGTGVFFVNSAVKSGAEDELISKSKATALAIALG
jgi:hypothetical protein